MPRVRGSAFARDDLGQSIVELALALPMMVFLLVGGADLARAFAIQLAVVNGARAGAEATAIDYTPSSASATTYALQEMSRTPGLDPLGATVTMTLTTNGGGACVVSPPTQAAPCFATVRVRYTWRTITPWPLLPTTFTFDRQTTVRRFS